MGWSRSNPSRSSRYAWSLSTVISFYCLDFSDYSLIPFLSFFLHNLWSSCIQCSAVCRIVYCLWVYVIPTCLAFLLSDLCVTTVCLSFLSGFLYFFVPSIGLVFLSICHSFLTFYFLRLCYNCLYVGLFLSICCSCLSFWLSDLLITKVCLLVYSRLSVIHVYLSDFLIFML